MGGGDFTEDIRYQSASVARLLQLNPPSQKEAEKNVRAAHPRDANYISIVGSLIVASAPPKYIYQLKRFFPLPPHRGRLGNILSEEACPNVGQILSNGLLAFSFSFFFLPFAISLQMVVAR